MGQTKITQKGLGAPGATSTDEPRAETRVSEIPPSSISRPTQRGLGDSGSPARPASNPPPPSGRTTQRGLTDSQPPKLITKQGLAPPPQVEHEASTADLDMTWEGEETGAPSQSDKRESQVEPFGHSSQMREVARDELTPTEHHLASDRGSDPGDRSQFKTAPGGGKNRISGGRQAAVAYVSPSTLSPGHGRSYDTARVKVHERVVEEARTFQTEPSLMRRRASSLPPPLPREYSSRKGAGLFVGALLVTLAVGGCILVFRKSPVAYGDGAPTAQASSASELPTASSARAQSEPAAAQLATSPPPKMESGQVTLQKTSPAEPAVLAPSPTPSAATPPSGASSHSSPEPKKVAETSNAQTERPKAEHNGSAAQPGATQPSSTPERVVPKAPSKESNDLWLE